MLVCDMRFCKVRALGRVALIGMGMGIFIVSWVMSNEIRNQTSS